MAPKQTRVALRWVHIVASFALGFYVYAQDDFTIPAWPFQFIFFPVLAVTGIWMWQQARVRRLLRRRPATGTPATARRRS